MGYFVASARSCFIVLLLWTVYLLTSAGNADAEAWEQQLASYRCQRRSKSLPLGRSKSRPVCLIFGYVFLSVEQRTSH
jgi:hypothetical protein